MMVLSALGLATMLAPAPATAQYTASVSLDQLRAKDYGDEVVEFVAPMLDIAHLSFEC